MHPPFYSALIHSEKQDIRLVSSTSKPWFKPREIPLFSPLLCTLKTANTVQISSCAYCMLLILPRLPHAFCFPALLRPSSPGFWLIDHAPRVRRVSQGLQRTPVTEEALSFKGAFKRCQENWNAPFVYSAEHSRSVSSARLVDHSLNGNVLNFTEEKLLDGKQENNDKKIPNAFNSTLLSKKNRARRFMQKKF